VLFASLIKSRIGAFEKSFLRALESLRTHLFKLSDEVFAYCAQFDDPGFKPLFAFGSAGPQPLHLTQSLVAFAGNRGQHRAKLINRLGALLRRRRSGLG